ncbi:MAG: thioredoxin domain-containing protein, partial [Gammaproteobacteria bacterium]
RGGLFHALSTAARLKRRRCGGQGVVKSAVEEAHLWFRLGRVRTSGIALLRHCCVIALFLCAPPNPVVAGSLSNQLAGHPSPYLALHANDPVAWQTWGPQAFEEAREENKLLFVSVGYFSCHWCHVMQRESYQNDDIAKQLNDGFIPIKVDRELEPALDSRLMNFLQATRGHGGWPLNAFVTPEGHPLAAIVYLPPDQFAGFLERLDERWRAESPKLKSIAQEAATLLRQHGETGQRLTQDVKLEDLEQGLMKQSMLIGDQLAGGFGDNQKFPSTPQLAALLTLYGKYPLPGLKDFLVLTLDEMAKSGLRDQLGGGFYRYTTDPAWRVPHFEKMLYDNALLAELYLDAARAYSDDAYAEVALDTLDFMTRDMGAADGAFLASLSAVDEEGAEGAAYLWQKDELQRQLSKQAYAVVELAWGFDGSPTTEGGYLPYQAMPVEYVADATGESVDEVRATLEAVKEKLLKLRANRAAPRDVKRLASWNGLALAAFAKAAAGDGERYRQPARELRDFIARYLWSEDDAALLRAVDDTGGGLGAGNLEDYAYVAKGLRAYATLSGQRGDRELAAAVLASAWRRFYTDNGWRLAESSLMPDQPTEYHIGDGATPSPSAVLLEASLGLREEPALKPAGAQIDAYHVLVSESLAQQQFYHATQIATLSKWSGVESPSAKTQ